MLQAKPSSIVRQLVEGLELIPMSLSRIDATKFTEDIIKIINTQKEEWLLEYWYRILGKINHRLSTEQRHRAALPAIVQLKKLQKPLTEEEQRFTSRREEIKKWLLALGQIPGGPNLEDQQQAMRLVLKIISSSHYIVDNYLRTEDYPLGPIEEISLLAGADPTALVELLKWPTLETRSIEIVMAALEKLSKKSFKNDVWQAALWAQSSGIDVSSQPSRPSL